MAASPELNPMADIEPGKDALSLSMDNNATHCDTTNDTTEAHTAPSCCGGETCDSHCLLSGCMTVTVPTSTVVFQIQISSLIGTDKQTTFQHTLYFPLLRPPIA